MANKIWSRANNLAYPTIWSQFSRHNLTFHIQDITPDLYSPCLEFMNKHFLPDEPLYTSINFLSDATSVKEQQDWWIKILPEKLSLVCFVRNINNPTDELQIAGINLLYYHHKSHDEGNLQCKGEKFKTVCDIVGHVENQIDRYELLNIEDYIDEFGLCVHPKYRGLGIATELLKARQSLGNAVGINATITIFTAIASQRAADKAEYKNLIEIPYNQLSQVFVPLNVQNTPSIRYMYKLFS